MSNSQQLLIHLITAARPNFMKIAPLWKELLGVDWAEARIIHTGQHYDANMSDAFFKDFKLPPPHLHLNIGGGSHGEQTGRTLMAYEKALLTEKPDMTVVVGDVNATLAATLAAAKLGVKVAHLEAGLRSFDRTMPEEINRVATDSLADLLWTPSPDGDENLKRENVMGRIQRVGNIMIDSLEMLRPVIKGDGTSSGMGLAGTSYGLVTFHRPGNVDGQGSLGKICHALENISQTIPLVFPVHPRTRKMMKCYGLWDKLQKAPHIRLLDPLSYIPFMNLLWNSKMVVTDSGGIQEETTYLGIPCFTIRPNTERPVTITQGTNILCEPDSLQAVINEKLAFPDEIKEPPELWDGRTAGRVVESIKNYWAI